MIMSVYSSAAESVPEKKSPPMQDHHAKGPMPTLLASRSGAMPHFRTGPPVIVKPMLVQDSEMDSDDAD